MSCTNLNSVAQFVWVVLIKQDWQDCQSLARAKILIEKPVIT